MKDDDRKLAARLLERASLDGQIAYRIEPGVDVPAVRAEVRRLAREQRLSIRTSAMGDVLAIVRSDASIWDETAASMRAKLTPNDS